MANLLEQGFFTTLGMFLFVQEKAAEAVGDLVDRGRLDADEGRRFVDDLNKRLKSESRELRQRIDDVVQESLSDAGMVTKADIREIKLALSDIDDRLMSLEEKRAKKTARRRSKANVLED